MELILAAAIGAALSSLRWQKQGCMKMLRVFLTGFFLAVYTGEDFVNFVQQFMKFEVSTGGSLFMISFVGAEVLERLLLLIKTLDVNILWNKKDDS